MNSDSSSRTGIQPKLRERIREATANEILAAADALFSERGVERTSMADIAARAGLAVGTLYNHFRDREALLSTLLDNHHCKLLRELDETLAACAEQPFADQLQRVLSSFFAGFERYRPLIEAMLQSCSDLASVSRRPKVMREIYNRFEILAKRGLEQKVLDERLVRLLPTLLLGVARTVLVAPILTGAPKMRPSDVELLVTFFLNGAGIDSGERP
ncbi:TetR/AcrR family transcriptional regulator [Haliangium sp. UPWRP_2]|uniref:TetR/AcrR family transcriptional regulator n=1 Tax=Haliangium sp. UPWRP_2 TaxID=1931276 RepID=UPI0013049FC9|nr:TetR/AcrR family transcriptional regulator [Haliangium sp. UPWRP_2]